MTDGHAKTQAAANRRRQVLFAGGGSAGHVFPGLAVAEVLAARGWGVSWAGRPRGMERGLVEAAGVAYEPLPASPLVGQGVAGKIKSLVTLTGSAWRGRRVVRRLGADVVVGTGGYVSAPAVLGARLCGCPSVLIEPNARAGAANRLLSRWSATAALAFGEAAGDFRCRAVATGTPVRAGFHGLGERPAGAAPSLLVLGGSQGAQQINELMPTAVRRLAAALPDVQVLHQTGAAHVETVSAAYRASEAPGIKVVPFLEDMPAALAAADLVISRAGAITLAELCAAGKPSILVPLSQAAGHQLDNAQRLEIAGAALLLHGAGATGEALSEALSGLLADRDRLAAMSAAARGLASANAAERIADLVDELGVAA